MYVYVSIRRLPDGYKNHSLISHPSDIRQRCYSYHFWLTFYRCRKLSHFLDILNIPRHYSGGHSGSSGSSNTSAQHSPLTPHAGANVQGQMATTSVNNNIGSGESNTDACDSNSRTIMTENRHQPQQLVQHDSQKQNQNSPLLHQDVQHRQHQNPSISFYGTACLSFQSEIVLLDMTSGEINDSSERYKYNAFDWLTNCIQGPREETKNKVFSSSVIVTIWSGISFP